METMTEHGVLPHPFLGGSDNPSATSVIHAGFFTASKQESKSTASTTPRTPIDSVQPIVTGTNFFRAAPMSTSQDYPPFPYKQRQFQQDLFSRDQGHSSGEPGDGGASNFPAFMTARGGFDRTAESKTVGFSGNPNAPAYSPPFPSQTGTLPPGFLSQSQYAFGTPIAQRGVPGAEGTKTEDSPQGIGDYHGRSMNSNLELLNQNGKGQYTPEDRVDANFMSPTFYAKHQTRFAGYGASSDGNKSLEDGNGFTLMQNEKLPAFHDSVRGVFRPTDDEAEPMIQDNRPASGSEKFNAMDARMKSRESLERSVSHDVQPVAWGPHLNSMREERDSDGRPLRSLTLDPTLHRRHSRPESFNPLELSGRGGLYPDTSDRRPSLQREGVMGSDRDGLCCKQEKKQEDERMLSPAKPPRLLSDNLQSTRDAESAAVPQQSPNRPGPATFHPDRMSHASFTKDGTAGDGIMSDELISKDQAPSQRPTLDSPGTGTVDSRPAILGDGLSKIENEGKATHQKDDEGDDVDGDPREAKSGDSLHKDGELASPSQNAEGNSNKERSDMPFFCDSKRKSAGDASYERDGSGGESPSFTTKRELFSEDEDEDGSQDAEGQHEHYLGNSSPRSMSPPSPDASITYPPHFAHPFFSPARGMNPPMSFGSPRGGPHADAGPGFPFGKDFPGPFPMPGMGGAPEMGMVGLPRMGPQRGHPAHPRFMNPMGVMDDDNKDIYFCHLCSYSGQTKSEFDGHMSTHFEFNCPHCDYTSRTEGRLKRHIKDFHSDDSSRRSMPGRPKIYRCKQCPFSAKEKDKFWEHARSHIKEDKLLQCPKCSFVTEYKHHLEYHLRNHFGSKPFKCTKCNYSCVNKSMLNSHMKSHTNVYQYRCSECTYATKYCHSLKLHLKKYGHKPATVLNQDGSLPQGLDVDASGLCVATKRGPPRGPRGPRKDKSGGPGGSGGDPYLNQLFSMPPVPMGVPGMGPHSMNHINPMLNGMMPFWPMVPHASGHAQGPNHTSPSQRGMLPGLGSLAHQMSFERSGPGLMPPHRLDREPGHPTDYNNLPMGKGMSRGSVMGRPHSSSSDDMRAGGFGEDNSGRDNIFMTRRDSAKHDYAACNLCDFVAENTRELCVHYVDVHKEEPGRIFGKMSRNREEDKSDFSSPDDKGRAMIDRDGWEIEKRRMSEPPSDAVAENGHLNNDFHRRNSLAGLLPGKGSEFKPRSFDIGAHASWQASPAFPDRDGSERTGMHYPGVGNTRQVDEDSSKSLSKEDIDTNILHQMTLKFGSDAPLERNVPSANAESSHSDGQDGNESGSVPHSDPHNLQDKRGKAGRLHKESPLDLTKIRPDSPSYFENRGSPRENDEEYNSPEGKEENGKSLSKVTESLMKKRPYPEDFQEETNKSSESLSAEKVSAIVPRKRSRKGKAYKLDTICLKLQEQQNSPLDSDDNESDMEMGFSSFQPLIPAFSSVGNKEENSKSQLDQLPKKQMKYEVKDREVTDSTIELSNSVENDGIDSDGTEDYTNDEIKDDFDDFKKVGEMTKPILAEGEESRKQILSKELCDNNKPVVTILSAEKADIDKSGPNTDNSINDSKNPPYADDVDDEKAGFEKLERSLKLLNSGEELSDAEMEKETHRPDREGLTDSKATTELDKNDSSKSSTESKCEPNESNSVGSAVPVKTENPEIDDEQRKVSECQSDKENTDASPEIPSTTEPGLEKLTFPGELSTRQASLEQCAFDSDEEIDQVDLIHTVLENRKKPLPPAVRRGTELAWKLLNDPVNPVTSLPIPVVASTPSSESTPKDGHHPGSPALMPPASCPAPRARPTSPEPPFSTQHPHLYSSSQTLSVPARPLIGPVSSSASPVRNGMRQHSPVYRQLHQYQQHAHYQRPPPIPSLHRNSHPIFPSPPHPYGPLPGMSGSSPMKHGLPSSSASTMPIPLPPTPMAFIPPTNRMDRIRDQPSSPGNTGEQGGNSHAKSQLPTSLQQKSELYECTYCDLTFRDCVMYTVHMGYHSNRNPFKCNSCGIICRDKVEFFLHIARSPHA